MSKIIIRKFLLLFVILSGLPHISAFAKTIDRFSVTQGDVRLEITALQDDILRIRADQNALANDESWAVSEQIRQKHVPFVQTQEGEHIVLSTKNLTLKLNLATLSITIEDQNGRIILADAKNQPLLIDEKGFRLRKNLSDNQYIFGLGDKDGPLNRRGDIFTLWNTDQFGYGGPNDPLYKSIPFFYGVNKTGEAYGMFVDTTWRSSFDFGKSSPDVIDIRSEGKSFDYYIMAGPDLKKVIAQYAYLTGTAPLAPLYGLGFQQSRWSYMSQAELGEIAKKLRSERIPADLIYADIDFQDRNRPFTTNPKTYPDLAKLVADLKEDDLRLVVITDLHIAHTPDEDYAPYHSGAKADLFLKNPDGTTYIGKVWPGPSVFPDFSRKSARDWWGGLYTDFVNQGVSGFWNDMNEPAIFGTSTKTMPLDVVHKIDDKGFVSRVTSHAELHNVYGMLNSKATFEGLLKLKPRERPFVLTRATYAGGQRYAMTWTGDNLSKWEHLRVSTPQLINLGLSGFSYAGVDIGGFGGEPTTPDLLTRWMQIGAFNVFYRNHYMSGKPPAEPWVHGPEHLDIRRRFVEERYRLLPYIYALAEENSRNAMPIMRPVFLEFPQTLEHLSQTDDQFMLGSQLLIAHGPVKESETPYEINLPSQGWYNYWTGERLTVASFTHTPTIDYLPVFVRPGAIFAKQELVQSTMQTPKGPLEIHIWPGKDCSGSIYFDDGISFDYRSGKYLRQAISCEQTDSLTVHFANRSGTFKPWWKTISLVIHGQNAPKTAQIGKKTIKGAYNADSHSIAFELPDMPKSKTISISD